MRSSFCRIVLLLALLVLPMRECASEEDVEPAENISNKELAATFTKHLSQEKDPDKALTKLFELYTALEQEAARRLKQICSPKVMKKLPDSGRMADLMGLGERSNSYEITKALVRFVAYHPLRASTQPGSIRPLPPGNGYDLAEVLIDYRSARQVRSAIVEFIEEDGLKSLKSEDHKKVLARVWMLTQRLPRPQWSAGQDSPSKEWLKQARKEIVAPLLEEKQLREMKKTTKDREKAKRIQEFIDVIARTPYTSGEVRDGKAGGAEKK